MADLDEQFRMLRAQQFAATFERVVWLDAALLAAIFAAVRTGVTATGWLLLVAAWMLGISLFVTLCIPMWRAIVNARHQEQGEYRWARSIYYVQFGAVALTGIAVLLIIGAFSSLI